MAEFTTAARPYAHAAFLHALETDAINQWSGTLETLSRIYLDPAMAMHLSSPQLDNTARVALLSDLLAEQLNQHIGNFLHVLVENKRLSLLPAINDLFVALVAKKQERLSVEISLATETPDSTIKALKEQIGKKFGQAVELSVKIDPELMAGGVIRIGDTVIDGSVRGRLRQLKQSLIEQV